MAYSDNISRLSRLTALLMKIQSATLISPEKLAADFEVSKRTIYRDIKSLQEAGIPIVSDQGGYSLMEGYHIPPIMFTEAEANAIIFGEKLISKTKDTSLIESFNSAAGKIKAVLRTSEKAKADFLASRTIIGKNWFDERTSDHLSTIQHALTNFVVLKIDYQRPDDDEPFEREIEPFAIYHNTGENWVAIAWCRYKKDFRSFRVDRIKQLLALDENFEPHEMTLEEYVAIQRERHFNRETQEGSGENGVENSGE